MGEVLIHSEPVAWDNSGPGLPGNEPRLECPVILQHLSLGMRKGIFTNIYRLTLCYVLSLYLDAFGQSQFRCVKD
jgi:hypothetical protein